MSRSRVIVAVIIVLAAVIVTSALNSRCVVYTPQEVAAKWYDVVCIDDNGEAQLHHIPVPEFFSFSPDFTEQYYQAAGEEYCESIRDKAVYVTDVGE